MSNAPIRPTTLEGVKRYAKTLKAAGDLPHAKALDAAAVAAGYQNFVHARRALDDPEPTARPGHRVYISVPWRDHKGSASGQEILAITLTASLSALVKPHHHKAARHLGVFRIAAADDLTCEAVGNGQSNARRMACAAARTLTFIEATGLRPSAGGRRAYPGGRYGNAMPGRAARRSRPSRSRPRRRRLAMPRSFPTRSSGGPHGECPWTAILKSGVY